MSGSGTGFRAGLVLSLAGGVIGVRAFFSPDCFRGACSVSGPMSGALIAGSGQDSDQQQQTPTTRPSVAPTLKTLADAQDALLSRVVDTNGLVRYSLLQSDTALRSALDSLVSGYAELPTPAAENTNKRLAFWCNAYNVNVMNEVLATGLPKRVLDVDGFFDKRVIRVGRLDLTLNDLENKYVRELGDPRIHAALNCAAVSCPALGRKAFRAETIDAQLDDLCVGWVNDTSRNRVDEATGTLHVSMIFKWFESDFTVKPYGSVTGFIRSFAKEDSAIGKHLKSRAKSGLVSIEYIEYDWTLNRAPEAEEDKGRESGSDEG